MSSPLKNTDSFSFLNGTMGPSQSGPSVPYDMIGSMAGSMIAANNTDPLADDYAEKSGAATALKYAGKGAAVGGPIGALAGLGVGLLIGTQQGDVAAAQAYELKKAEEKQKNVEDNMSTLSKNYQAMGGNLYEEAEQKRGVAMHGKVLKSSLGNIPKNMSAAQYKSGLKMQKISGVNTLSNY